MGSLILGIIFLACLGWTLMSVPWLIWEWWRGR